MALPPRGDFSFITDNWEREMLQSAFNAIETVPGGWNALLPEPEAGRGFMFQRVVPGSVMAQINQAIYTNYDRHSGSSYGWTMRQMQGIARLGWDQYVQLRLNAMVAAAMPAPAAEPAHAAAAGGAGVPITAVPVTTRFDDLPSVCFICYEPHDATSLAVNDGTNQTPLMCGHIYHRECILQWTGLGRRTCPACRGNIASLSPVLHIPPPVSELKDDEDRFKKLFDRKDPAGRHKRRKRKTKKTKKSHRRKTRR